MPQPIKRYEPSMVFGFTAFVDLLLIKGKTIPMC